MVICCAAHISLLRTPSRTVQARTVWSCALSENIRCGSEDLSLTIGGARTALERKYSVWIGRSVRIGGSERRVNEAAQEITFSSATGGVEGTQERILSLGTEPLRCEMLHQTKRRRDAQSQSAECAWPKRVRSSDTKWGRVQADALMMSRCSTERIPEGTK